MDRAEVERRVIAVVGRLATEVGFRAGDVYADTSLVDDIGLDSLRFVGLTLALEQALSLKAFPMQDWADSQLDIDDAPRFLVRQLVDECVSALEKGGTR